LLEIGVIEYRFTLMSKDSNRSGNLVFLLLLAAVLGISAKLILDLNHEPEAATKSAPVVTHPAPEPNVWEERGTLPARAIQASQQSVDELNRKQQEQDEALRQATGRGSLPR
jgi:hypothetical protein